jgi:hypothetical protein
MLSPLTMAVSCTTERMIMGRNYESPEDEIARRAIEEQEQENIRRDQARRQAEADRIAADAERARQTREGR